MHALLAAVVALALAPAGQAADAAEQVRLGYSDVENFPNQMGDGLAMADPPGVAIELIREAARDVGVEVEFVRMPAIRLLVATQSGELDGSFIFSFREERLQHAAYPFRDGRLDRSVRITTINYSFYKRADSAASWDGKVLLRAAPEPVGINYTFSVGDDLKKLGLPVDDSARSTTQNIGKLRLGRISAYATLENSADSYLRRHHIADVVKLQPPITSRDYYLIFNRKFAGARAATATRLWARIGELRDKRTAALLEKYLD